MTNPDTSRRAQQAREMILNSGNPDLIGRLHLLDAAAEKQDARPQGAAPGAPAPSSAPSPWGTGLAAGAGAGFGALGGVMLGTVLGGMMLDAQMRAAFAAVAEEAGFDPSDIDATLSEAAMTGEDGGAGDGGTDAGEDDWLDGFFDI